jgi:hypothetical protein
MKRIRLLVLAGVIAAALPFGMTAAGATGGGGPTNVVTVDDRADFEFIGTQVDVGLRVRCSGGSGFVDVWLDQYPPETPAPVGAGTGAMPVVCDGTTRPVGVTVEGALFDEGRAKATATLMAPSGTKTVVEWLTIVVV